MGLSLGIPHLEGMGIQRPQLSAKKLPMEENQKENQLLLLSCDYIHEVCGENLFWNCTLQPSFL